MAAKEHPDYRQELDRLDDTLRYIDQTILSQISKKAKVDQTVKSTMMHFDSSDSENYITLMINTMLQDRMGLRLKNLASSRKKPYFARVDFHEDGAARKEKIYIGKTSLIREEDQEVIIVDWRAPAANLYYEERLGRAGYQCPEGMIRGELGLKRQFSLDDGKLLDIMDIDITTNDEFLQSYLGANADNRLKDIVSTIQAEQNRVIRADMWNPLIVQGAAGSGKTTIALHRIAYLIYTYEKTIKPESFLIIAPNKLFLNYISEVLPELGVEKVKQTTFIDLALDLLKCRLKVQDPNEKLAFLTNTTAISTAESALVTKSSLFKSSMDFKRILEAYLHQREDTYLPEGDFKLGPYSIMARDEILTLFREEYPDLPFRKRMGRIQHVLQRRVRSEMARLGERLQKVCDQKVMALKNMSLDEDSMRKQIIRTIEKKDAQIREISSESRSAVKNYLDRTGKRTPLQYYTDFFLDGSFEKLSDGRIDKELIAYIKRTTLHDIKEKNPETEDLAPLLYLKLEVDGLDQKIPIEHIVVDEAQDLSVFQLYLLRRLIRGSSMTILGDLCQGIHSYRGTTDWNTVMEEVFQGKCRYLTLKQSYRTTVEIMDAANTVIRKLAYDLPLAEPVIRHGQVPEIRPVADLAEGSGRIVENIRDCQSNGLQTIAVLCKTREECMELGKRIRKQIPDIRIITGKEKEYPGGTVILPAYLAKGLEFDAVILADASADSYPEDPLHAKLLYVSMTRPLHRLYIYYRGKLTPLLDGLKETALALSPKTSRKN
jgi:DNA helicase-2/ATP-dependent DNA helicase PcrA